MAFSGPSAMIVSNTRIISRRVEIETNEANSVDDYTLNKLLQFCNKVTIGNHDIEYKH